jgi:hypothetical protein
LETLSDAAGPLPRDLKARHPEIPWRLITDFRNVLAHAYPDIRLDEVWRVIENELAPLKAVLMLRDCRSAPVPAKPPRCGDGRPIGDGRRNRRTGLIRSAQRELNRVSGAVDQIQPAR